jgi:hypothetical protein
MKELAMTRRRLGTLALVPITAIAIALATGLGTGQPVADAHNAHGAPATRLAFHDVMRKLWEDHITWTRLFIVSAATEADTLPDLGPTVDRLLANQTDIGNAIKPFYGDAAGDELTALLRVHILTAADLVFAAKAGDADATADASAKWYANADDIATFLSNANPKQWPLADMKAMMKDHLDLTLKEAVARIQGRYADDVAAYDEVHAEILQMADMLSDGIIAQFPSRFAQ